MIFRVQHNKDNPYFMLNRFVLEDDRLSWKATCILIYLLSKPDNWIIREQDLAKRHTDGSTSVRSALKELRDCGYIVKKPIRDDLGRVTKWECCVYEIPPDPRSKNDKNPEETQNVGDQHSGSPTIRATGPLVSNESLGSIESLPKNDSYTLSASADAHASEDSEDSLFGEDSVSNHTNARKRKNGCAATNQETEECKVLAEGLFDSLVVKDKIRKRPDLNKWTNSFVKFFRDTGTAKNEFQETLQWYLDHIEDSRSYVALCAETFCEKYDLIREQKNRNQRITSMNGTPKNYAEKQFDSFRDGVRNELKNGR